jgi:hypothetical protein
MPQDIDRWEAAVSADANLSKTARSLVRTARRAEAALQLDVKREPEPQTLQEYMDAIDAERAAEAARNRRPGSKTTADSSLAERFKPRCAVAQPAGTPARLLPADKRPPTRRGGRG